MGLLWSFHTQAQRPGNQARKLNYDTLPHLAFFSPIMSRPDTVPSFFPPSPPMPTRSIGRMLDVLDLATNETPKRPKSPGGTVPTPNP